MSIFKDSHICKALGLSDGGNCMWHPNIEIFDEENCIITTCCLCDSEFKAGGKRQRRSLAVVFQSLGNFHKGQYKEFMENWRDSDDEEEEVVEEEVEPSSSSLKQGFHKKGEFQKLLRLQKTKGVHAELEEYTRQLVERTQQVQDWILREEDLEVQRLKDQVASPHQQTSTDDIFQDGPMHQTQLMTVQVSKGQNQHGEVLTDTQKQQMVNFSQQIQEHLQAVERMNQRFLNPTQDYEGAGGQLQVVFEIDCLQYQLEQIKLHVQQHQEANNCFGTEQTQPDNDFNNSKGDREVEENVAYCKHSKADTSVSTEQFEKSQEIHFLPSERKICMDYGDDENAEEQHTSAEKKYHHVPQPEQEADPYHRQRIPSTRSIEQPSRSRGGFRGNGEIPLHLSEQSINVNMLEQHQTLLPPTQEVEEPSRTSLFMDSRITLDSGHQLLDQGEYSFHVRDRIHDHATSEALSNQEKAKTGAFAQVSRAPPLPMSNIAQEQEIEFQVGSNFPALDRAKYKDHVKTRVEDAVEGRISDGISQEFIAAASKALVGPGSCRFPAPPLPVSNIAQEQEIEFQVESNFPALDRAKYKDHVKTRVEDAVEGRISDGISQAFIAAVSKVLVGPSRSCQIPIPSKKPSNSNSCGSSHSRDDLGGGGMEQAITLDAGITNKAFDQAKYNPKVAISLLNPDVILQNGQSAWQEPENVLMPDKQTGVDGGTGTNHLSSSCKSEESVYTSDEDLLLGEMEKTRQKYFKKVDKKNGKVEEKRRKRFEERQKRKDKREARKSIITQSL